MYTFSFLHEAKWTQGREKKISVRKRICRVPVAACSLSTFSSFPSAMPLVSVKDAFGLFLFFVADCHFSRFRSCAFWEKMLC